MALEKLSDAKPLKAFTLNSNDINNYVFTPKRIEIDINKKYDIALVLGCSNYEIMKYRADEAIKLYRLGIIDKIFLTGGIGLLSTNREMTESYIMRQYMLLNGINDSDIIIEDKSKNTYENIKNSLNIIEKASNSEDQIVIVTSDFHSKRVKGIIEKMTPLITHSYGVLDGKHDIDKWDKYSISTKRLIRTEALLLSWYTQKEIIDDQDIIHINKKLR